MITRKCHIHERQHSWSPVISITEYLLTSNIPQDTYISAKKLAISESSQIVRYEECSKSQNETKQCCIRLSLKDFMIFLDFVRWNWWPSWSIILGKPIWRYERNHCMSQVSSSYKSEIHFTQSIKTSSFFTCLRTDYSENSRLFVCHFDIQNSDLRTWSHYNCH